MPVVPITRLQFQDKKVLVRCDFNVPIAEGKIQDPARIDASLDTIRYILEHGGSAVLCSHLGRPKERSAELSLKPVAEYLSKVLAQKVKLAPDCVGDHTGKMIDALKPGEALLLENLRFHKEEEANDRDFSHELARYKQVYVNDGFGTAHRAHASTVGVTRFLSERAAGFLMMRELDALRKVTEDPQRPSVAIMGGAKVSDKIELIRNLLNKVDSNPDWRRDGVHVPQGSGESRSASRASRTTKSSWRRSCWPRPSAKASRSFCRRTISSHPLLKPAPRLIQSLKFRPR